MSTAWQEREKELEEMSERERTVFEVDDTIQSIQAAHPKEHARYFLLKNAPLTELWDCAHLVARYLPKWAYENVEANFGLAVLRETGFPALDGYSRGMAEGVVYAAMSAVERESAWVPPQERVEWQRGTDLAVTLGELAKTTTIGPPARVGPLLTFAGSLTLFGGPPKRGKSTVAAWDAVCAMKAGKKVLWVRGLGEEVRRDTVTRFSYLGADPELLYLNTRPLASWQQYRTLINTIRPDVIYVDSLASFLNGLGAELPPLADSIAWHKLVSRFRTRVATCVLAHASSKKGGSDILGSTGILQAPDFIVTAHRDGDGRRLDYLGRHPMPRRKLRWLGVQGGYEEVAETDSAEPEKPLLSEGDAQVLAALTDGMLHGQWFAAAYPGALDPAEKKRAKSAFNNAIGRLLKRDHAQKDEATGRYTRSKPPVAATTVQ